MRLRPSRAIFCLVLMLVLSAVLGGVYGGQVRATSKGEDDIDGAIKHFSTLLGLVEENYAGDVDADKAVYGAIDGMLRTLDPHSKFFDPKAFNSLREDQRGKYYGLGITVTTRFGKVTVVSPPFLGSPAEKVGLRVGDVISQVNGESTQGMDLNEVVSKLKGPRGTTVMPRTRFDRMAPSAASSLWDAGEARMQSRQDCDGVRFFALAVRRGVQAAQDERVTA